MPSSLTWWRWSNSMGWVTGSSCERGQRSALVQQQQQASRRRRLRPITQARVGRWCWTRGGRVVSLAGVLRRIYKFLRAHVNRKRCAAGHHDPLRKVNVRRERLRDTAAGVRATADAVAADRRRLACRACQEGRTRRPCPSVAGGPTSWSTHCAMWLCAVASWNGSQNAGKLGSAPLAAVDQVDRRHPQLRLHAVRIGR